MVNALEQGPTSRHGAAIRPRCEMQVSAADGTAYVVGSQAKAVGSVAFGCKRAPRQLSQRGGWLVRITLHYVNFARIKYA